jgi:hypothetical protein
MRSEERPVAVTDGLGTHLAATSPQGAEVVADFSIQPSLGRARAAWTQTTPVPSVAVSGTFTLEATRAGTRVTVAASVEGPHANPETLARLGTRDLRRISRRAHQFQREAQGLA